MVKPVKLGSLETVEAFREYCQQLGLHLPCDSEILKAPESPLAQPLEFEVPRLSEEVLAKEQPSSSLPRRIVRIGNRWCIQPMEGWDGTPEGFPSERTLRRWYHFGISGAKLIWGGEAVAVRPDARANPNQLLLTRETRFGIQQLYATLLAAHRERYGSTEDLLIGLQLTHSGRFCKPFSQDRMEPKILYHHPLLDRRFGIPPDYPVLTDDEIWEIIESFIQCAQWAYEIGFHFVDIKHCHGYLGHEFLSAYTRPGPFGGTFENRTRFLREIVRGIQTRCPGLMIGVRLSAFDLVPFKPDPEKSHLGHLGPGIPEPYESFLPYCYAFGVNPYNPTEPDLKETYQFLELLRSLGVRLVNLSAGSPYYNPHIQRPAFYPPSDGYQPPEDPLVGVARQIEVVRKVKTKFPDLILVGSAYSYLQEFLPYVAQAVVREGWTDFVGLGRMILAYPEFPHDLLSKGRLDHRRLCRTFSDCTTAPRNGLPSGCYPLDPFYKNSPQGLYLRSLKAKWRGRRMS